MVERPIKKSERAERSTSEEQSENLRERGVKKNTGERDRDKGRGDRGKGRGDREEPKPGVPLALMRGPKPAPKVEAPKVEEASPEEEVPPEVTEEA